MRALWRARGGLQHHAHGAARTGHRFDLARDHIVADRVAADLVALLAAIADGTLAEADTPEFSSDAALTIVMAAHGYPGTPEKGGVIHLPDTPDAMIFHAGTALKDGQLIANGGRVLNVTARGKTVTEAQARAFAEGGRALAV